MSRQPGLHRRDESSSFYFRRKIPKSIRHLFNDQREIKVSLRTRNRAEAEARARELMVQTDRDFQAVRNPKGKHYVLGRSEPEVVTSLSSTRIRDICDQWERATLAGDESIRFDDGMSDDEFLEIVSRREETERELKAALARGRTDVISTALSQFSSMLGLSLQCSEAELSQLKREFLKATARTISLQVQRDHGEMVETPTQCPPPASAHRQVTDGDKWTTAPRFSALFDCWRDKPRPKPLGSKSIDAYNATQREFTEMLGDRPVTEFRKQDFEQHMSKLLDAGNTYKTVYKKVIMLKTLLNIGVGSELLDKSPAATLRRRGSANHPGLPAVYG